MWNCITCKHNIFAKLCYFFFTILNKPTIELVLQFWHPQGRHKVSTQQTWMTVWLSLPANEACWFLFALHVNETLEEQRRRRSQEHCLAETAEACCNDRGGRLRNGPTSETAALPKCWLQCRGRLQPGNSWFLDLNPSITSPWKLCVRPYERLWSQLVLTCEEKQQLTSWERLRPPLIWVHVYISPEDLQSRGAIQATTSHPSALHRLHNTLVYLSP